MAVAIATLTAVAGAGYFVRTNFQSVSDRAGRTYVMGTDNSYPYHFLDDAGKGGGMIGEVMQEAARRCGIRIQWQIHREGPWLALTAGSVDLWPLLSTQPETAGFHSTEPYIRNTYVLVAIDEQFVASDGLAKIHRLGVTRLPMVTSIAKQLFPAAEIVPAASRDAGFTALCTR